MGLNLSGLSRWSIRLNDEYTLYTEEEGEEEEEEEEIIDPLFLITIYIHKIK